MARGAGRSFFRLVVMLLFVASEDGELVVVVGESTSESEGEEFSEFAT